MGSGVFAVVLLIGLFQVKHLIADFFLQTPRMLCRRAIYLHPGRAEHAGLHGIGSAIVLALFGTPVGLILGIVLAEWVVHYHVDWAKGRFVETRKLTPASALYWYATGTDQALHQLTYLAIAAVWAACCL
ncbi:DUF3307 domain-containing protein [Pukyongiella litopenaei]|uniref:DUF3307 domain-containing protein n=1 Tax=Pukyongiella litopenaei TaxID=2605946 RepID=A0A2S0MQL9_9RHOB|nr:DUF3307 domain-containing protein [Pukyongiella litopenaei]AVO38136.1 DUF3307 domain-containing protein [Pukyongiella litopenaei]